MGTKLHPNFAAFAAAILASEAWRPSQIYQRTPSPNNTVKPKAATKDRSKIKAARKQNRTRKHG
ncbi:hypothetical protein [Cypionkella sinensis]|uniref:Uncharacterized protein n=1 Tax=Cypionkella sinensis TaxID=1756043 RepID=A0ABV7J300_9RHOB